MYITKYEPVLKTHCQSGYSGMIDLVLISSKVGSKCKAVSGRWSIMGDQLNPSC